MTLRIIILEAHSLNLRLFTEPAGAEFESSKAAMTDAFLNEDAYYKVLKAFAAGSYDLVSLPSLMILNLQAVREPRH